MSKAKKACARKIKHPNRETAMIVIRKQKNVGLSAYKCSICGGWHIGNDIRKTPTRIAQLLDRADKR